MRALNIAAITLSTAMLAAGCMTHKEPNFIYMPDMVYSPALKAQEGSVVMNGVEQMRTPVPGTVPRGYQAYPYKDPDTAGRELKNPVRPTAATMARGQVVFNTYCVACHGPKGEGDGEVVKSGMPRMSLQTDQVREYPDGKIYHFISAGKNVMPSYASQIAPGDRWATIHYLRALHKSKRPTAEDLKAAAAEE